MQKSTPRLPFLAAFLATGGALLIVRHGNTIRGNEDEVDFDRQLSERGKSQAAATRATLRKNSGGFIPHLVVSSSAPRAVATVADETWPEVVTTNKLYVPGKDTPVGAALDEAFARLGYQPLNAYRCELDAAQALDQWANDAAEFINDLVGEKGEITEGFVVIGCHAVMSPQLALTIALGLDPDAQTEVPLTVNMGEGELLLIGLDRGRIEVHHMDAQALNHPPKPVPATT